MCVPAAHVPHVTPGPRGRVSPAARDAPDSPERGRTIPLLTAFHGRIDRIRFWQGVLILLVPLLAVTVLVAATLEDGPAARITIFVAALVALYPALALSTRRLADRGHPPLSRLAIFVAPQVLSLAL